MSIDLRIGDCRKILPTLADQSVHCCVTSPPYFGLRDYGVEGQIGLEPTPDAYVAELVAIFREVRKVLSDDGTLWLNLGDSYSSSGRITQVAPTLRGNGKDEASGKQAYLNNFAVRPGNIAGLKPKDLIGIPWRVAFALQADGWYLRQDIIWSKPNPMPESVTDRCTKAHEYIFMLTKSARYYFDAAAIAEPAVYVGVAGQDANGFKNPLRFQGKLAKSNKQAGHGRRHAGFNARWDASKDRGECKDTRNKRSVWEITTQPFSAAHFATFPPDLIKPCILAGCPTGGIVLDPFGGAGTTGMVADRLGRNAVLIELNAEYARLTNNRIQDDAGLFAEINVT